MFIFNNTKQEWFAENVSLNSIAKTVGTPCYVYSKATLINNWHTYNNAFNNYQHQINYAVKANSNLAVLNILAKLNSGFDIVSIGELTRVIAAQGDHKKITFSGVAKTSAEISKAIQLGIDCINIESEEELLRINQIAQSLNKKVNIAFRINPNVDAKSHKHISTGLLTTKFGINFNNAKQLYVTASKLPGLHITGISFHIGSQITSLAPFKGAIDQILQLIKELNKVNINIQHINVGGGLGVRYKNEIPPSINNYVEVLLTKIKSTNLKIYLEPGRSIIANAGVLLTKVEYIKQQELNNKYFAIVDAGMNDLLRPALYQAWHDIIAINQNNNVTQNIYDIVGPICETSDTLGTDRLLSIKQNDILMIMDTGAYGASMSSNYNSRPLAAEVMVDDYKFNVIKPRQTIDELFKNETYQ